jgi:hypothetical protein
MTGAQGSVAACMASNEGERVYHYGETYDCGRGNEGVCMYVRFGMTGGRGFHRGERTNKKESERERGGPRGYHGETPPASQPAGCVGDLCFFFFSFLRRRGDARTISSHDFIACVYVLSCHRWVGGDGWIERGPGLEKMRRRLRDRGPWVVGDTIKACYMPHTISRFRCHWSPQSSKSKCVSRMAPVNTNHA